MTTLYSIQVRPDGLSTGPGDTIFIETQRGRGRRRVVTDRSGSELESRRRASTLARIVRDAVRRHYDDEDYTALWREIEWES